MSEMEVIASYNLCPKCDACPSVEIYESEVRIGEEGNLVLLKAEEWNRLVRAIKEGELQEVPCDCGCGCC